MKCNAKHSAELKVRVDGPNTLVPIAAHFQDERKAPTVHNARTTSSVQTDHHHLRILSLASQVTNTVAILGDKLGYFLS